MMMFLGNPMKDQMLKKFDELELKNVTYPKNNY